MSDDGPAGGKSFGSSLERVAEGGLLRVLAGKPVQLAVSRLVTGLVAVPTAALEIPTAFLQRITQGIRSDTEAKRQVSEVVLRNVERTVGEDAELTTRALQRWSSSLRGKQRNVEEVATRTVELLAADGELPPDADTPTEEFMGPFGDAAENASSEELADLMARILAGEIRKPGTISRRTLQTVAALDQRSVRAFVACVPYLLNGNWFHVPPSERDGWRHRFWVLTSAGITNEVGVRYLHIDTGGKCAIGIGSKALVCTCKPGFGGWGVDGANLTMVGTELLAVLPTGREPQVRAVALGLKEQDFVLKVEVGDLSTKPEGTRVINLVEVT